MSRAIWFLLVKYFKKRGNQWIRGSLACLQQVDQVLGSVWSLTKLIICDHRSHIYIIQFSCNVTDMTFDDVNMTSHDIQCDVTMRFNGMMTSHCTAWNGVFVYLHIIVINYDATMASHDITWYTSGMTLLYIKILLL